MPRPAFQFRLRAIFAFTLALAAFFGAWRIRHDTTVYEWRWTFWEETFAAFGLPAILVSLGVLLLCAIVIDAFLRTGK
jgi:hypothetical protein